MRIRTIKPEFWQDEEMSELNPETALLAIGLLNYSDDFGWFKFHPKLIQTSIFPLRETSLNIHVMLTELSNMKYIEIFHGTDGKKYGQVSNFSKHQKVNRPSQSKILPLVDGTRAHESSVNTHGSITEGSLPERNREQGTGNREGKGLYKDIKTAPSIEEIEKQALSFIATLPPQTTEGLPDQFGQLEAISFHSLWESREHPWKTQTGQDLLSGGKWISRLTKDLTDKIQEELKKAKRYGNQPNTKGDSSQANRPGRSSSRGDGNGLDKNDDEINPF